MRSFRFRVWLPNEKTMCELSLVNIKKSLVSNQDMINLALTTSCCLDGYDETIKDYVLIPFTGLKDRNGSDIYEGDLVRGVPYTSFVEHLGIVEFGAYDVVCLNAGEVYGSARAYGYYIHWIYPGRIRSILCQGEEENTDPLHENIEIVGGISDYYEEEADEA